MTISKDNQKELWKKVDFDPIENNSNYYPDHMNILKDQINLNQVNYPSYAEIIGNQIKWNSKNNNQNDQFLEIR